MLRITQALSPISLNHVFQVIREAEPTDSFLEGVAQQVGSLHVYEDETVFISSGLLRLTIGELQQLIHFEKTARSYRINRKPCST
jgi:hypothetical protein